MQFMNIELKHIVSNDQFTF